MQKQTEIYMKQNHMVELGDGVLVGLSGGADSVGLLLVLWKLRETFQISLRALHVHHGLRGAEADRDAAFSRMLCERLEIPFYEFRIDAAKEALDRKCSIEEAGRLARYRLYEETARAWEEEIRRVHIATAHHADDNAETVLFNLFRGSGLTGLSGIAPVRGRIIRPLLWAQRSEIQAWLRQQGQDWVEDSTNQESEYSRNWLRNELLPAVKERLNAQAVRHIDQASRRIRQADAYLEEVAEEWLQKHGSMGLLYASIFLIPMRVVMWSAGTSYFVGGGSDRKKVLRNVLTHPCLVGVYIGMFLMATQLQLPGVLKSTVTYIGNCNSALTMFIIGTILTDVKLREIINPTALKFSVLRLFLLPLLAYGISLAAGLDSVAAGVAVIMTGMPAGATAAIFAARYDSDAPFAAKTVVLTTLISMITIPAWCLFIG